MANGKTGNGEFYSNLLAKLEDAVSTSTSARDLFTLLRENGSNATRDERLAIYKKIRDARVWPEEASFYVIAWTIRIVADEKIFFKHPNPEFADVDSRMDTVKKSYGLEEDEDWPGEAPEEYEALRKERDSIRHRIMIETFRQCGENEMADLYLNNRERFDELFEAGRRYFNP